MRHLFATRAEVLRPNGEMKNGTATLSWVKVSGTVDPALNRTGEIQCRLDLTFVRPGKDQPMPIVAGRAPDRTGVMFYSSGCDIRAGDRVRAIRGPIEGTFEIRSVPDVAQGFGIDHHREVQIFEVARSLTDVFPGAGVDEYRVQS